MDREAAKALATFQELLANNPHTGTAKQVLNLSLGIAEASESLSAVTFALYRDESGLGEKVFSKLKVIGERLGKLEGEIRKEVIKGLPASYSTIYLLCALKPEELVTAVKRKQVTPKTSVRSANTFVKLVRFPGQVVKNNQVQKRRWSLNEEVLYRVCRLDETALDEDCSLMLANELRRVCSRFGVELQKATNESRTALREASRKELAAFWRQVLEEHLNQKWFSETSPEIRKQFNLKAIEEVWDAPLRTFSGFLIRTGGGREKFYEEHGQSYVAKLHYLQESTESRTDRYNLKRRIEEVLAHDQGLKLAVWRNIVLKNSGLL